jgi:hypothetical protein
MQNTVMVIHDAFKSHLEAHCIGLSFLANPLHCNLNIFPNPLLWFLLKTLPNLHVHLIFFNCLVLSDTVKGSQCAHSMSFFMYFMR